MRAFLVVLDSFGIGELPDAAQYKDEGSNTLAAVYKSEKYNTPWLKKMGLFNIDGVNIGEKEENPIGSFARLKEQSKGKDTTIGHWEISGIVSDIPLPTFPKGFPKQLLDEFSKRTGRGILCNKPYSGTEVIKQYGREHLETGKLIVYTSADSVFQIAAHEELVSVEELYKYCEIARELLVGDWGVGRVIARPFVGEYPNFTRTSNRHDYSKAPESVTVLDELINSGFETRGVGKIYDIFAGKGIQKTIRTNGNTDGMNKTLAWMDDDFEGLCFVNLVDFDMLYGHRNNVDGYANALTEFDVQLEQMLKKMRTDDVLIITADHGCDPSTASTDHSREYVPCLVYGDKIKAGVDLKTRKSFSDIAATIGELFGVNKTFAGESFLDKIIKK